MSIRVVEYIRADRSNPYRRWFERLDRQAAAKVAMARARLELGHTSAIKWFGGIGEYRIDWGPGYRIYLAKDGERLTCSLAEGRNNISRPTLSRPERYTMSIKPAKRPITSLTQGNNGY
jgi:putative addiction module killer protein